MQLLRRCEEMTVLSAVVTDDSKGYVPHSCLSYPFTCVVFCITLDVKFSKEKVKVEKVLIKWMVLSLFLKKEVDMIQN